MRTRKLFLLTKCGGKLYSSKLENFSELYSIGSGKRNFHVQSPFHTPRAFGLLLDIDGVICRGRQVLPGAIEAFHMLMDKQGRFRVPTVFVTNASNTLRANKSKQLGDKLGIKIRPEQMILAHSPLRFFRQFHDRHVLISGQGPILEIAKFLGFKRATTVDQLTQAFPNLDRVEHRRVPHIPCAFEKYFPPIEAILLFGEPVRWETHLQLIVDVLMTAGRPSDAPPAGPPYPHIPVLACNMDVLWMAEACLPRFGHGMFMLCLETVYRRLTGRELKYTALMGKPSELTYHHAEYCLAEQAQLLRLPAPKTIYAIGDNPESDILGANLFQQFLTQRTLRRAAAAMTAASASAAASSSTSASLSMPFQRGMHLAARDASAVPIDDQPETQMVDYDDPTFADHGAEQCYSVLVETGVYSASYPLSQMGMSLVRHLGELSGNSVLKTPTFVEKDLLSAVKMIFRRECFV